MKTLIIPCISTIIVIILTLYPASALAQSTEATVQATTATQSPTTFQDNFSAMLSSFPQKVLSTVSSIVVNSTNATSASEVKDSLWKKDNFALGMGLFNSSSVGIGGKYWLSELTALSLYCNVRLNIDAQREDNFSLGRGGGSGGTIFGSPQPDTVIYYRFGSNYGTLTQVISRGGGTISASIEKHLFSYRSLSPFILFGASANISSWSEFLLTSQTRGNSDTSFSNRGTYYLNGNYVDGLTRLGSYSEIDVSLTTSHNIGLSCHIGAGVEYFVLPSLSIIAQASVSAGISGSVSVRASPDATIEALRTSQLVRDLQTRNTKIDFSINNGQSYYGRNQFNVSGGVSVSTYISVAYYFGRNALGDIVNAFKSGTLFQW